jgi:hypothetical protein
MNYHKGFITPLLLILVAIFLLGGGAYVFTQNKQTDHSTVVTQTAQATSTMQISDWKTYRNDKYGFKFHYPKDWLLSTTTDGFDLVYPKDQSTISVSVWPISKRDPLNISCPQEDAFSQGSIVDPIRVNECKHFISEGGLSYTRTTVSGMSTRYTYKERYSHAFFLTKGNTPETNGVEVEMQLIDSDGNQTPQAMIDVYDSILRSFSSLTNGGVSPMTPVKPSP